tara:strand:- start:713 stop:895 length:183 start_codon:yes stop_codon:yes gene_type:complete
MSKNMVNLKHFFFNQIIFDEYIIERLMAKDQGYIELKKQINNIKLKTFVKKVIPNFIAIK